MFLRCIDCKHSGCRPEHDVTLRNYQQEALEKLQQPGNRILAAPTGVPNLLPLPQMQPHII